MFDVTPFFQLDWLDYNWFIVFTACLQSLKWSNDNGIESSITDFVPFKVRAVTQLISAVKTRTSLMDEWLEQAFHWHKMYCHDLEVMSLNPDWVKLGVHRTWTKKIDKAYTEHRLLFSTNGLGITKVPRKPGPSPSPSNVWANLFCRAYWLGITNISQCKK